MRNREVPAISGPHDVVHFEEGVLSGGSDPLEGRADLLLKETLGDFGRLADFDDTPATLAWPSRVVEHARRRGIVWSDLPACLIVLLLGHASAGGRGHSHKRVA